jgi:hypothetical protein
MHACRRTAGGLCDAAAAIEFVLAVLVVAILVLVVFIVEFLVVRQSEFPGVFRFVGQPGLIRLVGQRGRTEIFRLFIRRRQRRRFGHFLG